jgi:zinc transport system permease protein
MDIFNYAFMQHAMIAGVVVGLLAPAIGIFLVLRRYALIADTLAHASLAGIAAGLFLGVNPLIASLAVSGGAALGIEKLRSVKRLSGDWALSLTLSGSLAVAIILLSLSGAASARVMSYLFGSIVTVTTADIFMLLGLGFLIAALLVLNWRSLTLISFDEEYARALGVPVARLNTLLVLLSAATITIAIPALGVLLVSALVVVPVIAAMQLGKGFLPTLLIAMGIAVFSVLAGIILAYVLNLATSGVIVLLLLVCFGICASYRKTA